jgi:hypothetical protein
VPFLCDRDEHHVYEQWGVRDTPWLTAPVYRTADEILAFDPRTHDPSSLEQKVDRARRSQDATPPGARYGADFADQPGRLLFLTSKLGI